MTHHRTHQQCHPPPPSGKPFPQAAKWPCCPSLKWPSGDVGQPPQHPDPLSPLPGWRAQHADLHLPHRTLPARSATLPADAQCMVSVCLCPTWWQKALPPTTAHDHNGGQVSPGSPKTALPLSTLPACSATLQSDAQSMVSVQVAAVPTTAPTCSFPPL